MNKKLTSDQINEALKRAIDHIEDCNGGVTLPVILVVMDEMEAEGFSLRVHGNVNDDFSAQMLANAAHCQLLKTEAMHREEQERGTVQ